MGKVILIGGKVDIGKYDRKDSKPAGLKNLHPQILERLLAEMKGTASRIEIITSATHTPEKTGRAYKKALKKLKCGDIGVMHIKSPAQADRKDILERLRNCDGVMFTGGDQVLICKALLKSKFLDLMRKRFVNEKDFLVSGTSAGAMALTETIIARGRPSETLKKGRVKLIQGLGLLPQIIIDTHFINRERFGRLIEAVAIYPDKLGIGLGEDTAVYFKRPHHVETIGSNLVVLMDASHLSYNNVQKIKQNDLLCIEDLKLHVLPKGHMFNIPRRRIYKRSKLLSR